MEKDAKISEQSNHDYKKTIIVMTIVSCLLSIVMFLLYGATRYMPLIFIALISLMPVIANFILIAPEGQLKNITKQHNEESKSECTEKDKTSKNIKKEKRQNVFLLKINNFYVKYRWILLSLLIIAEMCAINVFFFITLKNNLPITKFNYLIPIVIACYMLVFLIMEKLCKHIILSKGDERYDKAILKGLRSVFFVSVACSLVIFADTMLKLISSVEITKYINIALAVVFVYETIFVLLSLAVRLIKHEFSSAPELTIPVPGIGGKDLGIISYLENNTGMSMRSLWSIKLIGKILPLACVSILVMIWLFSGVIKIESHQQGALYRFGKLQEEVLEPGLHFELPWMIDKVEVYDVGVINKMTIGYTDDETVLDNLWETDHKGGEYKLLLGGGNELVSINLCLEYKISDLKTYISSSSNAEKILQSSAYEVVTKKIINTNIENLLSEDRAKLSSELLSEITERASKFNTGLEIVSVVLKSIHPPVEVAEIYQRIISAGIKAEEIILNAQAEAAVLRAKANSQKIETINIEKKLAFESVAEAKAVVAEFLASVEADKQFPDDYKYQKYIKALTEAYSNGKLIIVGEGIDMKNVIYIGGLVPPEGGEVIIK